MQGLQTQQNVVSPTWGFFSGGLGALGLLRKQMWVVVGVQRALRREQHGRRGQEELTRR